MDYKKILRHKPWLKEVHVFNISNRLMKETDNAFVVYNNIQKNYELHTLEAYELSGDSYNTTLDPETVNGFLINDYKANDYKKFINEIKSHRDYIDHLYAKHENNRRDVRETLRVVERAMGTQL